MEKDKNNDVFKTDLIIGGIFVGGILIGWFAGRKSGFKDGAIQGMLKTYENVFSNTI